MNQDVVNPRPVMLPMEQVIVDEEIQVRVKGLHEETVEKYTIFLEANAENELPAVKIYKDENDDRWLADGFHRHEAYIRAARTEIPAIVIDGSRVGALKEAELSNLEHGLPLSNDDKKNILFRWLARGDEFAKLSTRLLADKLVVSNATIKRWIDEFEETVTNVTVDRSTVIGSDGREIRTENIGTNRPVLKPKPTGTNVSVDKVDGRGEVRSMPGAGFTGKQLPTMEKPQGTAIKPSETGNNGNATATDIELNTAILRRYKIEGPAAEMWAAVDKLLDTRNLDILTLLSPEDRESVRKQLFLGVTHSLRLFGQMVVLDSKPDQLDDQMQLVYEMGDLIDRIVEEVNKYAPVKNDLEYVDVEADDPDLPEDVQDAIEATGFRIDTWERGEDHFAVEVVKIIEHFQPPIQVMGHACDEMQRTLGLTVRYFNLGTKRIREVIENFQGPTEIGALLKIYDA